MLNLRDLENEMDSIENLNRTEGHEVALPECRSVYFRVRAEENRRLLETRSAERIPLYRVALGALEDLYESIHAKLNRSEEKP